MWKAVQTFSSLGPSAYSLIPFCPGIPGGPRSPWRPNIVDADEDDGNGKDESDGEDDSEDDSDGEDDGDDDSSVISQGRSVWMLTLNYHLMGFNVNL